MAQAIRLAEQRDIATKEAITSQRITDFMVSIFSVSDPIESLGNKLTAREILDRGAEKIDIQQALLPHNHLEIIESKRRLMHLKSKLGEFDVAIQIGEGVLTNVKLIVGKGNSAFETAESLMPYAANIHLISRSDFKFAWVTHYPGDLRSTNGGFIDTFFLKQQNAILNGEILSVKKRGEKYEATLKFAEDDSIEVNLYDCIINCTGFRMDSSIYSESIAPTLTFDSRLPKLNPQWECVNTKNLFYAGTLMQSNDYKQSSSAFVHGMRYNVKVLSRVITRRLRGVEEWDMEHIAFRKVYAQLLSRLYESSSLWFLFSKLFDLFSVDEKNIGYCRYYRDVPKRVIEEFQEFEDFTGAAFYFGYETPECLEDRLKFSDHGFLHPILKLYRNGIQVSEHHILEDIYGEWTDLKRFDPGYEAALTEFFKQYELTAVSK
ncbi:MAG: NAD(P)-binding domain-containing protein [Exilibacterium sp.]